MNEDRSGAAMPRQDARVRWRRPARRRLWLDPQGLHDGRSGERLSVLPTAGAGPAPVLLLSERLLTPVVAEAGLDLEDPEQIRGHAAHLLSHYHGQPAQQWPLAVWAEGRGRQRRFGAWALSCATQAATLQGAPQGALYSARPASLACLEACRVQRPDWAQAQQAALAWVEPGLLCWLELRAGVLQTVRHLRLASDRPEALLQRLRPLLDALPAGSETLLAGYGLSAALTELPAGVCPLGTLQTALPDPLPGLSPAVAPGEASGDFLPAPQALARWRWPLLGVALLCLGLAGQEAWQAYAQRQSLREDLASLQARQGRQPGPGAVAVRSGPRAAAGEPKTLLEARQALQQPWHPLLGQIEAAALDVQQRPLVAWLGLDLQAGRAEVRLEGQADDRTQVLAVTEALARLPGWSEVLPAAIQDADAGQPGLRFSLQARLAPGMAIVTDGAGGASAASGSHASAGRSETGAARP